MSSYGGVILSCFRGAASLAGMPLIQFKRLAEKVNTYPRNFTSESGSWVVISIRLPKKMQIAFCGLLKYELHMQLFQPCHHTRVLLHQTCSVNELFREIFYLIMLCILFLVSFFDPSGYVSLRLTMGNCRSSQYSFSLPISFL